jgi:putative flippase GtrA
MKKIAAYKENKLSPKQTAALIAELKLFSFNWWLLVIDSLWQQRVVRYFFAAATATVVDVFVFWFVFNKVLHQNNHDLLGMMVLKAPTLSLICGFSCGLITNFTITKFFVFNQSEAKTRWQLLRFIMVAVVVLVCNYYFMWFLTAQLKWYATISRAVSAVTVGIFSFTAHKFFSFKL